MPSFFSKVFNRKISKDSGPHLVQDNNDGGPSPTSPPSTQRHHKSNPSLLEGKFEAVITPASPIASNLAEANGNNTIQFQQRQDNEKDSGGGGGVTGFALLRSKSRPSISSSPLSPPKRLQTLPALSFNHTFDNDATPTSTSSPFSPLSPTSPTSLTSPITPASSRVLGVVFEGDDRHVMLDENLIGSTRLSPAEALVLVRACSLVIAERGLETLGIMHPHWYSASPEIQRRLISLFIHTLSSSRATTTQQPSGAQIAFESELKSTRSPHDVAAVLRWGLRHLQLDGGRGSFGLPSPSSLSDPSSSAEWSWYTTFFLSERSSSASNSQPYNPKAYTTFLPPLLPPAHLALLTATLEILSSLAAHAEGNGMGGSKLCRGLGWWVCSGRRDTEGEVVLRGGPGWEEFYGQWEKAGRVLEHLFLARIRDESVNHRMPTRLLELVKHYPYNKGPLPSTDKTEKEEKEELLLPRPRFSTRTYDALFVRIDTELPHSPPIDPSPSPSSPVHPINRSSSKVSSKVGGGNKSTATVATTATGTTGSIPHPKRGHLRLLGEAFKADLVTELESEDGNGNKKYVDAWKRVRSAALLESSDDAEVEASKKDDTTKSKAVPVLNRVFADETIRLLSLIPGSPDEDRDEDGAGVELLSGVGVGSRVGRSATKTSGGRRSSSFNHVSNYKTSNGTGPTANGTGGHSTTQTKPAPSVPLPPSPVIDWAQFTTAGFEASDGGAAAGQHLLLTGLLDPDDVEVTKPQPVPAVSSTSVGPISFPSPFGVVARTVSRSRSGKGRRDASTRRSSADSPNANAHPNLPNEAPVKVGKSKATCVKHIQLDEAFVDFWSDAVLDPISASWPTFVVCKLNPGVGVAIAGEGGRTEINWLVVEQTYTSPPVPHAAFASQEGGGAATSASEKRTSSPRPSLRSDLSRMSSTFGASTRKRFSFLGGGGSGSGGVVASGKIEKAKAKSATATGMTRKSSVKGVRVGEMGEVLPEVVEKPEIVEKLEKTDVGTKAGLVMGGVVASTFSTAAVVGMMKTRDGDGDKDQAAPAKSAAVIGASAAGASPITDKDVVDSKEESAEHPVITEADATKETQKNGVVAAVSTESEPTLPPAPENVVLSGSTPGPQVALETSELATPAKPTPTAGVAEAAAPILVEDAPGPQVASDTEPAIIEPLKFQDEPSSVLPVAEGVPVVPTPFMAEDTTPAPEPESVAELAPLADGPTTVEQEVEAAEAPSAPEPDSEPVVDATPPSPQADVPPIVEEQTKEVVENTEGPTDAPVVVEEETEKVSELAEAPTSVSEPELESEPVPEPVIDAIPSTLSAEAAAVVEEEVVEPAEAPAPVPEAEPEPEPEPAPEPIADATPPIPLAEAAAAVDEEIEGVVEPTEEPETIAEEASTPPAGAAKEEISEIAKEATPELAVELEPPAEAIAELQATLPDEETSPAAEIAEESHPEPEPESVVPEFVPKEVQSPESEEATPSEPDFTQKEAPSHEAGEALTETIPEHEPVTPKVSHEEVSSPEDTTTQALSEPESAVPEAPHEEASFQAAEEVLETSQVPESVVAPSAKEVEPVAEVESPSAQAEPKEAQ